MNAESQGVSMYGGQIGGAVLGGVESVVGRGYADARQSEIPSMVERLGGRINDLGCALDHIEQRLASVTRGEPKSTAQNASPTPASSTGLGSELQTMGDRVGEMHDKVCALLRLLEL